MTDTAFVILLQRLIEETMQHPHKDEIIDLAFEQWVDDTYEVSQG